MKIDGPITRILSIKRASFEVKKVNNVLPDIVKQPSRLVTIDLHRQLKKTMSGH